MVGCQEALEASRPGAPAAHVELDRFQTSHVRPQRTHLAPAGRAYARRAARCAPSGERHSHGGLSTVHPRFAAFDELPDEREPPA